jgi:SAM-dependent methyltransferase
VAEGPAPAAPEPWNHNSHYHRVVVAAIPAGCDSALDVGCGTGRLTREIRRVIPRVTGIDRDEQSITVARTRDAAGDIEYRCGDFLDLPLKPGGFGLVTAVASLHHMDTAAALIRMREQLRPGGVLVIIGLAREGLSPGLALNVPAFIGHRYQRFRHQPGPRSGGAASAPGYQPPVVWPPAETYRQVRRLAGTLLPGMRYRRHLLWRYSICWMKPG